MHSTYSNVVWYVRLQHIASKSSGGSLLGQSDKDFMLTKSLGPIVRLQQSDGNPTASPSPRLLVEDSPRPRVPRVAWHVLQKDRVEINVCFGTNVAACEYVSSHNSVIAPDAVEAPSGPRSPLPS